MLADDQLKNLLNRKEFSNVEKALLCLATDNATAKAVKVVRAIAVNNGLRPASKWNFSQLLAQSKGKAVLTSDGWELTTDGRSYLGSLLGPLAASPAPAIASSLRVHLTKIPDADVKKFVEEGINCFEHKLYRSAVVLSWVGAVALLYQHVVDSHLASFNAEAGRRWPKWKPAKNADDIAKLGEFDFLQVIEHLSIIGKNVKNELEKQLKLRNGCGHPNSLKIAEHVAASHLEILILNVFAAFA